MAAIARLSIELSGGCELLFGNQPRLSLDGKIPVGTTIAGLVVELRNSYVLERPDQFAIPAAAAEGSAFPFRLRPGVLALVNDCDAEVLGGEDYVLEEGDVIAFISTLHGG